MSTRITAAVIVLIMVASVFYFIDRGYFLGEAFVPDEFTEARKDSAFVAEKIVFISHQSLAGLEQIGGLDELKKYNKALEFVAKELERNQQARQEAILLSSHLGTMVVYLPEIKPSKARAFAMEAINYEINLVNRLISFHGLLNNLFELLEKKFRGDVKNGDDEVKKIITDLNEEIKTINNLNARFNSAIEEFDKYFK